MEDVYFSLNENDFRELVAGREVQHIVGVGHQSRQLVTMHIILSDIGFAQMRSAIQSAMEKGELGAEQLETEEELLLHLLLRLFRAAPVNFKRNLIELLRQAEQIQKEAEGMN